MTNKEIRTNLIENMRLFLEKNCCYNYAENAIISDCLEIIEPANDEFEKYNEANPNHGKPIAETAQKDYPDDWKNKPLKVTPESTESDGLNEIKP